MNIQNIMKKAQDLQQQIKNVQDNMKNILVEGSSGGDVVKITADGKGEIKKISIDKSIVNPNEIELLEDLILTAINNVKAKAAHKNKEEMEKLGIDSSIANYI